MQDSFARCTYRPLSWSTRMELRRYGRIENCSVLKHNDCLSAEASRVRGPKLKLVRVSAFEGSFQNEKSGGRKSGSKLPKNWVNVKEKEDTAEGPPQANDIPLSYVSEADESIASSHAIPNLFNKWLRMLQTQSSGEVVDGISVEPPPKERYQKLGTRLKPRKDMHPLVPGDKYSLWR